MLAEALARGRRLQQDMARAATSHAMPTSHLPPSQHHYQQPTQPAAATQETSSAELLYQFVAGDVAAGVGGDGLLAGILASDAGPGTGTGSAPADFDPDDPLSGLDLGEQEDGLPGNELEALLAEGSKAYQRSQWNAAAAASIRRHPHLLAVANTLESRLKRVHSVRVSLHTAQLPRKRLAPLLAAAFGKRVRPESLRWFVTYTLPASTAACTASQPSPPGRRRGRRSATAATQAGEDEPGLDGYAGDTLDSDAAGNTSMESRESEPGAPHLRGLAPSTGTATVCVSARPVVPPAASGSHGAGRRPSAADASEGARTVEVRVQSTQDTAVAFDKAGVNSWLAGFMDVALSCEVLPRSERQNTSTRRRGRRGSHSAAPANVSSTTATTAGSPAQAQAPARDGRVVVARGKVALEQLVLAQSGAVRFELALLAAAGASDSSAAAAAAQALPTGVGILAGQLQFVASADEPAMPPAVTTLGHGADTLLVEPPSEAFVATETGGRQQQQQGAAGVSSQLEAALSHVSRRVADDATLLVYLHDVVVPGQRSVHAVRAQVQLHGLVDPSRAWPGTLGGSRRVRRVDQHAVQGLRSTALYGGYTGVKNVVEVDCGVVGCAVEPNAVYNRLTKSLVTCHMHACECSHAVS